MVLFKDIKNKDNIPNLILTQLIKFLFLISRSIFLNLLGMHGVSIGHRIPRRPVGLNLFILIFLDFHNSTILINLSKFSIISLSRLRFVHNRLLAHDFNHNLNYSSCCPCHDDEIQIRDVFHILFHCSALSNEVISSIYSFLSKLGDIFNSFSPVFMHNIITFFYRFGSGI